MAQCPVLNIPLINVYIVKIQHIIMTSVAPILSETRAQRRIKAKHVLVEQRTVCAHNYTLLSCQYTGEYTDELMRVGRVNKMFLADRTLRSSEFPRVGAATEKAVVPMMSRTIPIYYYRNAPLAEY